MSIPFTQLNKLYIDGAWVSANGPAEAVLNPATEEVIGQAPVGDSASADAAIAAARPAFDSGPWPWLSMAERANYMRRMHSPPVARREEIAALTIAEGSGARGATHALQGEQARAQ